MNIKFITLLLNLVFLTTLFAQTTKTISSDSVSTKPKKNMIGLNTGIQLYSRVDGMLFFVPIIPNTEIFNPIGLKYDRAISKKITLGLELNYKMTLINDIGFIKSIINAEVKSNFYVDKAFEGFYVSPYVGVNSIQFLFGEPTNFLYLGSGIGYVIPIDKNLRIDINYKPAYEFSLSPENKSKIWSNRFGVGVGYAF
jgi:hypothetical protein